MHRISLVNYRQIFSHIKLAGKNCFWPTIISITVLVFKCWTSFLVHDSKLFLKLIATLGYLIFYKKNSPSILK